MSGNLDITMILLEHGAAPNAKGEEGVSALVFAAFGGHSEILTALIRAGADLDAADSDGETSLMAAAKAGHSVSIYGSACSRG